MTNPIGWCEQTWNPMTGCTPISECYAQRMARRLRGRYGYPDDDPFRVTLHPEKLTEPMRWKKPRLIFVCSMGDLFHDEIPFEFIDRVFATMVLAPQHTYLLLTKRPDRMAAYMGWLDKLGLGFDGRAGERGMKMWGHEELPWPLPNVWLGVTAENQARADERIPILLSIPAAKRFVSIEPMLGPVDLRRWLSGQRLRCPDCGVGPFDEDGCCTRCGADMDGPEPYLGLDWVICGGETGPGARPMHPDWVRSLRDQCVAAEVPFWFKAWGNWAPSWVCPRGIESYDEYRWPYQVGDPAAGIWSCLVGKKAAGHMLDGQEWKERP